MLKRALLVMLLAALAPALSAKVYFVNKGVKYHIGDGHADRSLDSDFLDTYPVVGEEWIQAFTVSEPDAVRVNVDEVWGVDDCPYCKVMIDIDGHEMGRLFEENNHQPFHTPSPLAMRVEPGHVYQLRVSTRSTSGSVDDMAFEGVSIETDKAAITLLEPGPVIRSKGQPLPAFRRPEKPQGPCEGAVWMEHWLPTVDLGRGHAAFDPLAGPAAREAAAPMADASFVRVMARVDEAASVDAVSQYLEVLLGDPGDGWVLSFAPGASSPSHGNLKRGGRYDGATFRVDGWKAKSWNELRLARCPDGSCRLWINGSEQRGRLQGLGNTPLALRFRTAGLKLVLAEKSF
jgi:hypothetical protein